MSPSDTTKQRTQEQWKQLNHCIKNQQFDQALELFNDLPHSIQQSTQGQIVQALMNSHQGHMDRAKQILNSLIAQDQTYAEAYGLLGQINIKQGDYQEGLNNLASAIHFKPEKTREREIIKTLSIQLAQIQLKNNDIDIAINLLKFARTYQSNPSGELADQLGVVYKIAKKYDLAIKVYNEILAIMPNSQILWGNLASVYEAKGDYEKACEYYEKALTIDPNFMAILSNYGNMLAERLDFKKSEYFLARAYKLAPNDHRILCNYAGLLKQIGQLDPAMELQKKAIGIKPDDYITLSNLGMNYLTQRNYSQGWEILIHRFKSPLMKHPEIEIPAPSWDGKLQKGFKLYIVAEQSCGDQVFFASLIPELLAAGLKLTIECDVRLIDIFNRSFKGAKILKSFSAYFDKIDWNNFDAYTHIGSLGRFIRKSRTAFKNQSIGYLKPKLKEVKRFKNQYLDKKKHLIGLSWYSSVSRYRSLGNDDLLTLVNLFKDRDVALISLQYGDVKETIDYVYQQTGLKIIEAEDIDQLKDMNSYTDLVAACDFCVGIDSTPLHVASALGVKSMVLLPKTPGWRWTSNKNKSEWYPNSDVSLQIKPAEWDDVFKKTKTWLNKY